MLIPSAAKSDGSVAEGTTIEQELEIDNDFVFAMLGASPRHSSKVSAFG